MALATEYDKNSPPIPLSEEGKCRESEELIVEKTTIELRVAVPQAFETKYGLELLKRELGGNADTKIKKSKDFAVFLPSS
jgi:hypothetical protein